MRIRDYLTRSGQQSRQHSQSRRGLDQKKNLSKAQLNARRLILESLEHRNLMAVVWAAGAELPQARVDAAAVVGSDEAVYILGGNSNNVDVLQAGATNWESGGAIDKERVSAGVGAIADGRILLFGGSNGGEAIEETLLFDPVNGDSQDGASMSTVRAQAAYATDSSTGLIYAFGGVNDSLVLMNSTEVYDPSADVWSSRALMPQARADFAAASDGAGRYGLASATVNLT